MRTILQAERAYRQVFASNHDRVATLAPWLEYGDIRRRHAASKVPSDQSAITFSPVRDPRRFPVCPLCKELAGMLGIGG